MGFFDTITDTLFGSKPDVSYAPKSGMQTDIQKLLQQYLQQYQGQMTGATPVPTYTGQMTAGLTPLQTQSISNIGGLQDLIGQTGALSPAITDIISKLQSFGEGDILSKTMSTISGLQNLGQGNDVLSQIMKMISGEGFDPSYMRAAYQTGIEDPLRRTFTETTMPAIESAYAKSGLFYGSDKQRQVQDTSATLMNALAQGRTGLESNIYTAGLAQQQAGIDDFSQWLAGQGGLAQLGMTAETQAETLRLKAAEQAGTLGLKGEEQAETKRMQTMSQMMQGLGLGMTAGGIEQATTQAELTNQYNQWLRTQAGTMPTDQLLAAILSMYQQTGEQAVVTGGSQGILGPLGLAGMGFADIWNLF